jgi:hypothetical protein
MVKFSSFWDTYASPYIDSFSAGWDYGDEAFTEGVDYNSSFLYTVGDYAEDFYDESGLDTLVDFADTALDKGAKLIGTYKEGAKALSGLWSDGKRPSVSAKPQKVGAPSVASAGTFSASDSRIGITNPNVRQGMDRLARNSSIPWVSSLIGGQVPMTTRGGQRNIRIETPSITMRKSTKQVS